MGYATFSLSYPFIRLCFNGVGPPSHVRASTPSASILDVSEQSPQGREQYVRL